VIPTPNLAILVMTSEAGGYQQRLFFMGLGFEPCILPSSLVLIYFQRVYDLTRDAEKIALGIG
jgi:hypothetical protein